MSLLDKIKDFLSTFKSQEKDIAQGLANINIQDQDDAVATDPTPLKYMYQLVRVNTLFYALVVILIVGAATSSQP